MSRVAHWIQHKNVDFYPTSIDRQNWLSPLAEFAILHFQILSGTDTYANIVQWYSFFISIIFGSLIAKELDLSVTIQIFAGLFIATIPMAICQSTSTQNDLVAATFCMGFAYFLLRLLKKFSFQETLFCSLSFGLALLTKGTSYIYCCAIGLALSIPSLIYSVKVYKKYFLLKRLALIVAFGVLINSCFYIRNYNLYANPVGSTSVVANGEVSTAIVLSNIVRNVALHLCTPFDKINSLITTKIETLLGKQTNNPKSTYPNKKFSVSRLMTSDGKASNPIHLIIIIISLFALPLLRISNHRTLIFSYAGMLIFSVLLFCAILKWQPWGSRLHTTAFMLSAPFVCFIIAKGTNFSKNLSYLLAFFLFFYSIPFLVVNKARPLISPSKFVSIVYSKDTNLAEKYKQKFNRTILNSKRNELYFFTRPELYHQYRTATSVALNNTISGKIGLYLDIDDWEYPFWVFAGKHAYKCGPEFIHFGVTNVSNRIKRKNLLKPDIVISTKKINNAEIFSDRKYSSIFETEDIKVFRLEKGKPQKVSRGI
jgi:hypothetical protein